MKLGILMQTVLCCISLLGLSMTCLATETPNAAQKQEEAIVVRIDHNDVTLQAVGDKDRTITAPFSNAAEFKVGDKVVIIGNTLRSSEKTSDDKAQPNGPAPDIK
ncbi:MAG: hypothetical protein GJT30_11155 [Geobacter sp.]|nr:hypothetical protein [Geobacter sp.]